MGSQNVTNFSAAKANRIRAQMKGFNPQSPEAGLQAWVAAADAIGEFTKSNSFVQCLASSSVETALRSLISLASSFKYKPEQALQQFNIDPANRRPFGELAARMTQSLSESLTATQQETESTSAARDAIPRTIIDVLSEAIPREKVGSASPEQIREAFKNVPARRVSTLFIQNVISSLLNMTFDAAAEGKIPRADVAKMEERNREQFAAEISRRIERLSRDKGIKPSGIPSFIRENIDKPKSVKELERVRVKNIPLPLSPSGGAGFHGIPKGKPAVITPAAGFHGIPKGKPPVIPKPKKKF